jgi:hypothetical protein
MPGIAHLVFGLFLVIPIFYIARDKFNYKVALIFVLNNWNGPDSYWAWRFIPINAESIYGYLIWIIPLSLYYSYLSRFSLQRSKNFVKLVDDGVREVNWRHSYLLCLSGGLLHNHIDAFFHRGGHGVEIFPEFSIPFDDFLNWGISPIEISSGLIVIGFVLMIVVSILAMYYLGKDMKDMFIFLFAVIGVTFLLHFTLGGEYSGNELEIVAIGYNLFYLFIPLMLLAYVANYVNKKPRKPRESPLLNRELGLKLIAVFVIILAGVVLYLGIDTIIGSQFITELIGGGIDSVVLNVIGMLIIGASLIGLIGAIGLFFKINYCRYMVILVSILLFFFVYPFAIALFLCDKDIKALFTRKTEET